MDSELEGKIEAQALKAKEASAILALSDEGTRNSALMSMASGIRQSAAQILAANEEDVARARETSTPEPLIDRLMLNPERIESIACALEELCELPDPLGRVLMTDVMYNGIQIQKVSVPLGLVAVVYEARPNVTADAAGICIKSGNACILRGGSLAANSNQAIADVLAASIEKIGLPRQLISYVESADRSATDVLLGLHGIVDVLIPRGGAGLIEHCVMNSKVPVIETGTGNCHVYIHHSADPSMAKDIVVNSKCRRLGVCNAAETLLLDEQIADDVALGILEALSGRGIALHLDDRALSLCEGKGMGEDAIFKATERDWETEYLSADIAVKYVDGVDEAIDHINRYGTKHSESIVASDESAASRFLSNVDAAAVYHNAATSFTDGGQFGLGAEIGISTQKLHVRGPFALEGLTSYKYICKGTGQVRD